MKQRQNLISQRNGQREEIKAIVVIKKAVNKTRIRQIARLYWKKYIV